MRLMPAISRVTCAVTEKERNVPGSAQVSVAYITAMTHSFSGELVTVGRRTLCPVKLCALPGVHECCLSVARKGAHDDPEGHIPAAAPASSTPWIRRSSANASRFPRSC
jgi:hypothetical protein